ncbi:MAG TPA: branched-chain amino acid ABC transporter permease [Stellaceae bacterium]|nr:branched-chain amino acid ABC transporter permease [Stellaceae bacterium]
MTLALFIEQLFNGVQFGLMLFLMAVGVTLVFGIMRVINLAHGSLFMVGGYLLVESYRVIGSYWLALPVAIVGVIIVGAVMEVLVLRPLYGRGHLDQVLATFGLTMFFNEAVVVIWGRVPLNLNIPAGLDGHFEIFPGVNYPVYRLAITAAGLICGGLLYFIIVHTRLGALIRAGSDKREIVEALGVNIGLLYTAVFALGAAFAGLAGMLTGPLLSVESGMGDPILILTLVVIVIGGSGSIRGALAGSLILGIFDTFSRVMLPRIVGLTAGSALVGMADYVLMATVLIYSRTGLFSAHRG